jgi:hypothetical protein
VPYDRKVLLATLGVMLLGASTAQAAAALPMTNPNGLNCVGINRSELWRDYDGPCKFGAYVPPMQGGSTTYERKKLDAKLTEIGMPLGLRVLTLNELDRFQSSNSTQAKKRIRRDAARGKRSKVSSRAVLCAAFGAIAAGANVIAELLAKQKIEDARSVAKDFTGGCIAGLATPRVLGWVKKKGFQLEA